VLPDGRNFGLKAQKGPGKNKTGQKDLWPNFNKIGRKEGRRKFVKNVPYLTVLIHFQRHRKTLI
jgi:hypothetical protein